MNSRTRPRPGLSRQRKPQVIVKKDLPRVVAMEPSPRLFRVAVGIAVLATLVQIVGSVIPVVMDASPGFASVPLRIVLAVVPLALVVLLSFGGGFFQGRRSVAAGLLIGLAVLSPGRLLLDLQFLFDPSAAMRPELFQPTSLARPAVDGGFWLLAVSHLLMIAAGLVAIRSIRSQSESVFSEKPGERNSGRWIVLPVLVSLVVAIGLIMPPFSSLDVYLLATSAFEASGWILSGSLFFAVVLPLTVLLVASIDAGIAKGCLAGLALAAISVVLPNVVAGWSVPGLEVSAGPIVVLIGAFLLLLLGFFRRDHVDLAENSTIDEEPKLPGLQRLRLSTGLLGVITAALSLIGALTPQVIIAGGENLDSPANGLLVVAGALVGVISVGLFLPRVAPLVRPVLSVSWVGVLLAGAAVLNTAVVSAKLSGLFSSGSGVVWTTLAMVSAVLTACFSVVTGFIERDELAEEEDDVRSNLERSFLVISALLVVGALGIPSLAAPDYVAPGIWLNFTTPSWGLLTALGTVLGVVVMAARCRRLPAAGLLMGAAGVVALRVLELPLLGDRIQQVHADFGWWLAIVTVLVLLASAVVIARDREVQSGSSQLGSPQ